MRPLSNVVANLCIVGTGVLLAASACAQPLGKRIDNLPLYGQPGIARSEEMQRLDETFITEAVAGLGSRELASKVWYSEGERFFAQGNFDYAMRRYNQAWLLNPNSFKPYWGIARVLLESDRIEESMVYFSKSIALVDDRYQEPALLTDAANAHVFLARQSMEPEVKRAEFAKADTMYAKVLSLDPEYGNAYKRYPMSLYYQGSYANAWEMLHQAQKRPDVQVPPAFVDALRRALPEPAK